MTPARREAMAVAMALVPGLMPRNKLFAFYKDADAKSARRRGAMLRNVALQVANGAEEVSLAPRKDGVMLAYRMANLHASRRALLTSAEAACVAYLVEKSGGVWPDGKADRALLDAALAPLGGFEGITPSSEFLQA
ncbi:MAG: hypothetical protein ABI461_01770 [Polyangiaceae bacterium]